MFGVNKLLYLLIIYPIYRCALSDSIVEQLRDLALDPNSDVEELLNKALFVARKLKIKDFRKWCELELEGYGSEELPIYRKLRGQLKAVNRIHGYIPFIIPPELDEIVTLIEVNQGIGELNNLLKQEADSFMNIIIPEMRQILLEMQKDQFSQLEPRVLFARTQLMGVLTKIRTIILNWSIQLEEDGILGEGLKFSKEEKKAAMSVNHFNIQNMQGVVGNVSGGIINQNNQMKIKAMDFDSLAKHLAENNVAFSDIHALKEAIEHDPKPNINNKFGEKVSGWIGSMVGKAASGSWDISVATAGTLLAESLAKFYGLG